MLKILFRKLIYYIFCEEFLASELSVSLTLSSPLFFYDIGVTRNIAGFLCLELSKYFLLKTSIGDT